MEDEIQLLEEKKRKLEEECQDLVVDKMMFPSIKDHLERKLESMANEMTARAINLLRLEKKQKDLEDEIKQLEEKKKKKSKDLDSFVDYVLKSCEDVIEELGERVVVA